MASKSLSPKFLGFTSMNNCYVVVMELLIRIKVFLNSHGSCVEAVMIFVSVDGNVSKNLYKFLKPRRTQTVVTDIEDQLKKIQSTLRDTGYVHGDFWLPNIVVVVNPAWSTKIIQTRDGINKHDCAEKHDGTIRHDGTSKHNGTIKHDGTNKHDCAEKHDGTCENDRW